MLGMVPAAIDVSTHSTTTAQVAIALAILVVLFVILVILRYRSRTKGLPPDQTGRRKHLEAARAGASTQTIRFPGETDFHTDAVRQQVARLFEPGADIDQQGVRTALAEIRADITSRTLGRLPRPARRLFSLALLVATLGSVAVSTGLILRALRAETGRLWLENWPAIALEDSAATAQEAVDLLFTVPGVELLWSLWLSAVLIGGQWAYAHWYVVAAGLALGAAFIAVLDHRGISVPAVEEVPGPNPTRVALRGILATLAVWVAMLVGIGTGRVLGPDWWGVRGGLVAAGAAAIVVLAWALVGTGRILRDTIRALRSAHGAVDTWGERVMLLVWLGSLLGAVLVAPLVPIWGIVAITKLPTLIAAFLAASLGIKALAVATALAVVGVLVWQTALAWDEIQPAVRDTLARQQVRVAALKTGVPLIAVVGTYILAYAFVGDDSLASIVIVATFAVAVGLGARALGILLLRARYHLHQGRGGTGRAPARRVVVQGARLEADGAPYHWARINGTTDLLHPDQDVLVDAICDIGESLTATGESPVTLAEWHARLAFEAGITDAGDVQRVVAERARKQVFDALRSDDSGMVQRETIEQRLDELPDDVVDERFETWRRRGEITERDEYVVLRYDPTAQ